MLAYKDFGVQRTVTTGTFIRLANVVAVPIDESLLEANAWLEEERGRIQVVSVETVQKSEQHPFLRVWYLHTHGEQR